MLRAGMERLESGGLSLIEEMLDQQRDILAALAQRGQVDHEDVQAVEKVEPEPAVGHFGLDVAMGGGDDSQIDLPPVQRAHRAQFLLLDQPQQLDLHFERQIADFVEKGGAAVGHLHQALLVVHGSAEGALDVSEQLAFHERAHQRAAIDGNEAVARARIVNGAGHHLFPGAALAEQQHREAVARGLLDQAPHGNDRRRRAHQSMGTPFRRRFGHFAYSESSRRTKAFFSPDSWRIRAASASAPSWVVSAPTRTRHSGGAPSRSTRRAVP